MRRENPDLARHLLCSAPSLLAGPVPEPAGSFRSNYVKRMKHVLAAAALLATSAASAGPILIVNGASQTSETVTTEWVTNNLHALHLAVGNTVTILDALPADVSGYSQIWDIRFDNLFALDSSAQNQYLGYLQGGGGLFLMGENSSFMDRNHSVFALIAAAGGGSVGFTECDSTQQVHAPFTGPNTVATVNYSAPGCFDGKGNGQWISAESGGALGSGLAFGVGSLTHAGRGALTTILDVNFMMNEIDLPNSQDLTKNLIRFVGNEVDPPVDVPVPATLALFGLGLLGLSARRRI